VLLKGYGVFRFAFNYAVPVISFAFCYWRILVVIRRQNTVTATHAGRSTRVQVKEAVAASANVDGTNTTNVKTGQAKCDEHGNRYVYKLIEIFL